MGNLCDISDDRTKGGPGSKKVGRGPLFSVMKQSDLYQKVIFLEGATFQCIKAEIFFKKIFILRIPPFWF